MQRDALRLGCPPVQGAGVGDQGRWQHCPLFSALPGGTFRLAPLAAKEPGSQLFTNTFPSFHFTSDEDALSGLVFPVLPLRWP